MTLTPLIRAQSVAFKMGDLAWPELGATGFDQVGQFISGVVDVALMPPIKTDLIGETVGDVIGKIGGVAVFVGQPDQTADLIVVITQLMTIGIDPFDRISMAVIDPVPCTRIIIPKIVIVKPRLFLRDYWVFKRYLSRSTASHLFLFASY
jgi:hypothetical protein